METKLTRKEMEDQLIVLAGWNEDMVKKASDSEVERWWQQKIRDRGVS